MINFDSKFIRFSHGCYLYNHYYLYLINYHSKSLPCEILIKSLVFSWLTYSMPCQFGASSLYVHQNDLSIAQQSSTNIWVKVCMFFISSSHSIQMSSYILIRYHYEYFPNVIFIRKPIHGEIHCYKNFSVAYNLFATMLALNVVNFVPWHGRMTLPNTRA